MRRRSIILTTTALTIGALAVAAPAHADVVTHVEVTDATVVHVTTENFIHGDYTPWAPEGPATFPSSVDWDAVDQYALQGYAPVLPALAAGCTRTVDTLTLSFATAGGQAQTGFYVGVPAAGVDGATAEFTGEGTLITREIPNDSSRRWFAVAPVDGAAVGTITLSIPETSDAETFLGFIGFERGDGSTIQSISFGTTVTCPDPAVAPAAPELAATGVDQATAVLAVSVGGGAVMLGIVLMVATRARRRDSAN
ncbi:MAG: hypothetical protein J0H23_09850 [Micrococcales bacterium]|nr:hypothetical protein [Micrococcales bacterium]OJX69697.1 MAG: hypothetical protein BGO94_14575 [Micrococcales bacterium 72-143]